MMKPKIIVKGIDGLTEKIKSEDISVEGNKIIITRSALINEDKESKEKAKKLLSLILPKLQDEINQSVEDALALYEPEYLDVLIAKVNEGVTPSVKREEGCINLHVGRRAVNLS